MAAADYAAQANSIYDPQYAASKGTLDATHQATIDSYASAPASINYTYDQSGKKLAEARASEGANLDFHVSQANAGGVTTGLLGNEQRVLGEHYIQNVQNLESERAMKLGDITTQLNNENRSYGAQVNSLGQTIQSSKAQYMATGAQNDAANAESARRVAETNAMTERLAANSASLQRELADKSNAVQQSIYGQKAAPTANQQIGQIFIDQKYGQISQVGLTEKVIVPQIMAQMGLSHKDALAAAYAYRKQTYGE